MSNFLSPTNPLVKVLNSFTNAIIVPKIVLACVHLTTILIKVFVPAFKVPVVALSCKCLKNKLNTFYISNSKCWSVVCFFKVHTPPPHRLVVGLEPYEWVSDLAQV